MNNITFILGAILLHERLGQVHDGTNEMRKLMNVFHTSNGVNYDLAGLEMSTANIKKNMNKLHLLCMTVINMELIINWL